MSGRTGGEERGRRVTLATVARALGISPMTVSNAYNRPEKLSAALRERVLAKAAELGYAGPDPTARSLRRGRAGTLGVVLGEALPYAFGDPGAIAFLRGLAEGTADAGVALQLVPVTGASGDVEHVLGAGVDGFVLFALPEGHAVVDAVVRRALPVVVHGSPQLAGRPFVSIDNRAAAAAIAARVTGAGHRRLGIVSFPLGAERRDGPVEPGAPAAHRITRERLAGFRAAPGAEVSGWEVSLNERSRGAAAAAALLDGPSPPTALLCMSDELAVGALDAARARGLAVPRELSVTGFDDLPDAARADPALTTVHQSLLEQGRAVAALALQGTDAPATAVRAPWEVVVRGSVSAPTTPG